MCVRVCVCVCVCVCVPREREKKKLHYANTYKLKWQANEDICKYNCRRENLYSYALQYTVGEVTGYQFGECQIQA
jgi:hypothetical protein